MLIISYYYILVNNKYTKSKNNTICIEWTRKTTSTTKVVFNYFFPFNNIKFYSFVLNFRWFQIASDMCNVLNFWRKLSHKSSLTHYNLILRDQKNVDQKIERGIIFIGLLLAEQFSVFFRCENICLTWKTVKKVISS